jgi:2,4-dienoyl-CoA reductase (NADPH2)
MTHHERFGFKNLADLEARIASLGLDIRLDTDLEPLGRRVKIGALDTPNSLAIHPLEGRDSTPDGRPGELTFRRYQRFAKGGAGIIWFEATTIVPEGRASPRQLLLNEENLPAFRDLLHRVERSAAAAYGPAHRPVTVLQLTHSGRYSKPVPVIAVHNETLDAKLGLPSDYPLISDGELEALENRFVEAAKLAHQVGFRAVDIKACHGYLASELLAARTRPGRYGGGFENRTRFLINIVEKIRKQVGNDLTLAIRLNAYDGIPYPHGWGVSQEDVAQEDLAEPIRLVRLLYDKGVRMVSISAGTPYYNPHVSRPFDTPVQGGTIPNEHPLQGVSRLFRITRQIQQAVPEMVIVGAGYSWLRQFLGYAATANILNGWVTIVGVGREALAYPDFARDLLTQGELDPKKTCITCSRCSQLMRDGGATGCVVFDAEVYRSIYNGLRAEEE